MAAARAFISFVLVVSSIALAFVGCGGAGAEGESSGGDAGDSALFEEILTGLRTAAQSNTRYTGIERAHELPATQEIVLDAFCETAWQLAVNDETDLLADRGFIVPRISGRARALNGYSYAGIPPAMKELRAVIDLGSYDARLNRRYKKACNL